MAGLISNFVKALFLSASGLSLSMRDGLWIISQITEMNSEYERLMSENTAVNKKIS